MQCVTTVRYSFLVNGQACGSVSPSRGLRQGDPLSPYLFLLCAEGFLPLLQRKVDQGLLGGVKVCANAPSIHYILFADDSLLFGTATIKECGHIQSVLVDYERPSGQCINLTKSDIVFSKNVPASLQASLAGFLGLPLWISMRSILVCLLMLGGRSLKPYLILRNG